GCTRTPRGCDAHRAPRLSDYGRLPRTTLPGRRTSLPAFMDKRICAAGESILETEETGSSASARQIVSRSVRSPLTHWTIERRPAGLDNAADCAATPFPCTGLVFAIVHREVKLEVTQLAVGASIITQ